MKTGDLKSIAKSIVCACPVISIHGEEHSVEIRRFLFCLFASFLSASQFECKLQWSLDIFNLFIFIGLPKSSKQALWSMAWN